MNHSSSGFGATRARWLPRLSTVLLIASLASTPGAAQVAWRQVGASGPAPIINNSGIAYDSGRDVVVAFGGWSSERSLGDTWEWDGARWKRVSQTGPSPRLDAHLVYDEKREVIVLYGGCECNDGGERYPRDMWEWDGETWTQVATDGPIPAVAGPRPFTRMIYQPADGSLLLHHGGSGETWEWDGAVWTLVDEAGPEGPRWNFAMVHDSRRDVTVLHGGVVQTGDGSDPRTWEWDGESWRVVAAGGPSPRHSHAAVYDGRRGAVVLHGGQGHQTGVDHRTDTWEWDGDRWRQLLADGAPPRAVHRMVYDRARGQVLVASGGVNFSDVEIEVDTTWVLDSPIPASRGDFDGDGEADPAVYDPATRRWKIHGAQTVRFGARNGIPAPGDYDGDGTTDLAFFDGASGVWRVQRQFKLDDFGKEGDLPAPADYDGDGSADAAVFRPSEGLWEILGSAGAGIERVRFGRPGDVPIPADYDGDGRAEPAVYRPATRQFLIQGGATRRFGKHGAIPVPADYDGDGTTDLAVWSPLKGSWKIRGAKRVRLGELGQIPAPGDYDGDGRVDPAVYDPEAGLWTIAGQETTRHGGPGELPIVR